MLLGNPAAFVNFFVAPPSLLLLPADLDGPPPSAGTSAPFVRHVDGDLWGGVDRLEVFEFSVNFQNPAASTFNFVVELPTDPFSAVLCGSIFFGNCAEQPSGSLLETLPAWLMWRLQYRNFGTHETLVANHTIDVDDQDHAGIRWYELRRSDNRSWKIFQQGTFAPQDPAATSFLHRWMGSIAMDQEGNIALGFSASSSTVVPSVRYVGRRVADPLGSLPQGDSPDGDVVMVNGEGSQSASRWGDYSSMSIDPVDECTFWYTQEYVGVDSRWRSRIGAFRFPSCGRARERACNCQSPHAILGGPADDILRGTSGDDIICGFGGDDKLLGKEGNDCLDGGAGNDWLNGGADNDVILGQDGIDDIRGGSGDDILRGDDGNDVLRGNAGNDVLRGNAGRDTLLGGPGDDELRGGHDDDVLLGGRGDDDLRGGGGRDTCIGGSGTDTAVACQQTFGIP